MERLSIITIGLAIGALLGVIALAIGHNPPASACGTAFDMQPRIHLGAEKAI